MRNEHTFKSLLKFAIAGTAVATIGMAIVTFYPSPKRGELVSVPESQADIFALSFAQPTNTEKLGSSLERLGHEPPRVYLANGNTVFFSTAVHRNKRPREVLRDYQEEFVRQKLNSKAYTRTLGELESINTAGARQEMGDIQAAAMNGEIIPYALTETELSMGGSVMDLEADPSESAFEKNVSTLEDAAATLSRAYEACGGDTSALAASQSPAPASNALAQADKAMAQPETCAANGGYCSNTRERYKMASQRIGALKAAIAARPALRQCEMIRNAARANMETSKDGFMERIKAFRSIEAVYDPTVNTTHVSATWSNEAFDATKFRTSRFDELEESKSMRSLPLCDGCRRTWDFRGSGGEEQYASTQVISPNSPSIMADYYLRTLEAEGWKVADSQRATDELMRLENEFPDSRYLRVVRGDEHMTVRIAHDGTGSRIFATSAN